MSKSPKTTSPPAAIKVDLSELGAYLARDRRIIAATVFGSAQNGQVRSGGDLDLAVLFHEPLAPQEYLQFYTALCDRIPGVEKVDLVTLNQAHPILAFEAVRGRFLCKNDPDRTAAFFSLVCREYEDVMGNLEHQRQMAS